jgi:hypothetical protein
MAGRRYVRDNKGRFASTGATARGGRLRTEAGNKRATRTMQAEGGPRGTIGKPKGLKPGAIQPKSAAANPAPKRSSGRRRPTAAESRAAGLTPISELRARRAAAQPVSSLRQRQSKVTGYRNQEVVQNHGKQPAPFGRYSTIKKPAPEGSFPQMAPGRTGTGMSQAAKGRNQPAAPKRRAKTDQQVLQQADRVMGKLAERMKSAVDGGGDLNAKMRQVQRNNRRGGRVNAALNRRGLLDRYQKLTAGADAIHGTRAGRGISPRRR